MRHGRSVQFGESIEAVKPPHFQNQEAFAYAFQKVGLMFDEQDGLAARPEARKTFGYAFAVFGTDAGRGKEPVHAVQVKVGQRTAVANVTPGWIIKLDDAPGSVAIENHTEVTEGETSDDQD